MRRRHCTRLESNELGPGGGKKIATALAACHSLIEVKSAFSYFTFFATFFPFARKTFYGKIISGISADVSIYDYSRYILT